MECFLFPILTFQTLLYLRFNLKSYNLWESCPISSVVFNFFISPIYTQPSFYIIVHFYSSYIKVVLICSSFPTLGSPEEKRSCLNYFHRFHSKMIAQKNDWGLKIPMLAINQAIIFILKANSFNIITTNASKRWIIKRKVGYKMPQGFFLTSMFILLTLNILKGVWGMWYCFFQLDNFAESSAIVFSIISDSRWFHFIIWCFLHNTGLHSYVFILLSSLSVCIAIMNHVTHLFSIRFTGQLLNSKESMLYYSETWKGIFGVGCENKISLATYLSRMTFKCWKTRSRNNLNKLFISLYMNEVQK